MSQHYHASISSLCLSYSLTYYMYCIEDQPLNFHHICFSIISWYSIIGVIRWGNDTGDALENVYNFTSYLQSLTTLPLITFSILWINQETSLQLALFNVASSLTPLIISYILDIERENIPGVDAIILIDAIYLGVVAGLLNNCYGVAAAILYPILHFGLRNRNNIEETFIVPKIILYNYGLMIFGYLAVEAISREISLTCIVD